MSIERIDQVITAWEERLRRVDENLLALEAEPTYQMLAGAGGRRAPLDGITERRVVPALDALSDLFEHRERLTEVLERAKEVRASISALTFWNTDEKLAEIDQLLNGPSIKMGTRPTPLAQRNLLDAAAQDVAVVPEQLLQAMVQAYDVARTAVLEVQAAWARLEPTIEQAEQEATSLRATAKSLGAEARVERDLAAIEHDLHAMRARVAKDPLGIAGSVDAVLAPRLSAMRQELDALGGMRDRVAHALARARELRRRLEETHRAARAAKETGPAEIVEAAQLPPLADEDAIAGLDPWLDKLAATIDAGRWQAADVGLGRWFEAAGQYFAADRAVAEGFAQMIARRTELQGRLAARRAQARAVAARRGAGIDAAVEAKGREAETLLERRPTPLGPAAALVQTYEAAVVALARA